ncbi:uncharacterized protein EDB93DRAFT_1248328 [Suillus bovinus]|uniref:uncharacterized protein n=1 Tax=Suillus bovinus TaxID=48563 RepID=UPI001B87DD0E|nr:uncharacterized protein EDB93DRAFT_1248328 [Suillus bovinus]KAG2154121.1 hypothetical protein EDB93DRAFT_1248328 [Suillus bovinus]
MAQKVEKRKKLDDAITSFVQDQSNRLHKLVVAHDVSDKQVKDILSLKPHYHRKCCVQLRNVFVHIKSKELNEGHPIGDKYSLEQIQNIIDSDPAYKQLSAEEEQDYIN